MVCAKWNANLRRIHYIAHVSIARSLLARRGFSVSYDLMTSMARSFGLYADTYVLA